MTTEPAPRRMPRCPICKRPASKETRPFCSTRCAQVDLGRWLTGGYAVPGEAEDTADKAQEDD